MTKSLAEDRASPKATGGEESKLAFFRQSGWMVTATFASGLFLFAVHKSASKMPEAEYGVFNTLLQVFNLMMIPALGLQMVFAQQTASAITPESRGQLTASVRAVALGTLSIWLAMAVVVFGVRDQLVAWWKIANPAALWVTVVVGLGALWLPIALGVLQGKQAFLWFGCAAIVNGFGRFLAVSLIVLLLGGYAAGAMTGVLFGVTAAFVIGMWHTRDVWLGPCARFAWRDWLARVVPLTLGLGASQFMLSADMLVVRSLFDEDTTGLYAAAGMIGRGLVAFTAPLVFVMFPKIARSAARAEKTDVLALTLGAAALLGGAAAVGCTVLPRLPLLIVFQPAYLAIAPLVPWFAWCMLPLALANVLINSLLARRRYRVVPWLILVAAGYGLTLLLMKPGFVRAGQPDAFKVVVQVLGGFSLLLFAVAAGFTWGDRLVRRSRD